MKTPYLILFSFGFCFLFIFSCQKEHTHERVYRVPMFNKVPESIRPHEMPVNVAGKRLHLYLGFTNAFRISSTLQLFDKNRVPYEVSEKGLEELMKENGGYNLKNTTVFLHVDEMVPVAVMRYLEFLLFDCGKWAYRYVDAKDALLRVSRDKNRFKPCPKDKDCLSMHEFSNADLKILSAYEIVPEINPILNRVDAPILPEKRLFKFTLNKDSFDLDAFEQSIRNFHALPFDQNIKIYQLHVEGTVSFGKYHLMHASFTKLFESFYDELSMEQFGKKFSVLEERERMAITDKLYKRMEVIFHEGC